MNPTPKVLYLPPPFEVALALLLFGSGSGFCFKDAHPLKWGGVVLLFCG